MKNIIPFLILVILFSITSCNENLEKIKVTPLSVSLNSGGEISKIHVQNGTPEFQAVDNNCLQSVLASISPEGERYFLLKSNLAGECKFRIKDVKGAYSDYVSVKVIHRPPPAPSQIEIPETLMGFNSGMMFVSPKIRRAFAEPEGVALSQQFGSKVIRFPGGTVANCYHPFKRGTTIEAPGYGFITDNLEAPTCSSNSLRSLYLQQVEYPSIPNIIRDLIAHINAVKSGGEVSVIYVPNILSGTQEEYRFVMDTFQQNNIKVVGVELGNELYFNAYRTTTTPFGCKNEVDYIQRLARPVAQFFRSNYPTIKISLIVPGNFEDPSLDTGGGWKEKWIEAVNQETQSGSLYAHLYDAYSVHGYFNAKACTSFASDYKKLATCAYENISNNKNNVVGTMKSFFTSKLPSRLEAWVSEWNIDINAASSTIKPLTNTMVHGCITTEFMMGLIQNSNWVKNSDLHSYSSAGIGAGMLFNKKTGTTNMNEGNSVTAAVTYYSLKFINQAIQGGGVYYPNINPIVENTSGNKTTIATAVLKNSNGKKWMLYSNCSGEKMSLKMSDQSSFLSAESVEAEHLYDSAGGAGYSAQDPTLEIGQKTFLKKINFPDQTKSISIGPYSFGVVGF